MPRPCKRRRVCFRPERQCFRPAEARPGQAVEMTVDEFESIRLIDLEGLTQEDCARRMDVSRATVQAIYGAARTKLARFLVQGRELVIGGGEFVLCPGGAPGCGRCHKHCQEEKRHEKDCSHL